MAIKMISVVTCAYMIVQLIGSGSRVAAVLEGCTYDHPSDRLVGKCVDQECFKKIENHIEHELNAAFQYLYMAAYFDDEAVARPGLAKFLYEAASEERSHAILMLEYMNRRGLPYAKHYTMARPTHPTPSEALQGFTPLDALQKALAMEMEVTEKINDVVTNCNTDFDAADFLTEVLLSEQFEGQRRLMGAISHLTDLRLGMSDNAFADFMFDQKLLKSGL